MSMIAMLLLIVVMVFLIAREKVREVDKKDRAVKKAFFLYYIIIFNICQMEYL